MHLERPTVEPAFKFDSNPIPERRENMNIFEKLGFWWDQKAMPTTAPERGFDQVMKRFDKSIEDFVWNASAIDGNPFTREEVETLLKGISVGNRTLCDQGQVLSLIEAYKYLHKQLVSQDFSLSKSHFSTVQSYVTQCEHWEYGVFRGEGRELKFTPSVRLGSTRYYPTPTVAGGVALNRHFHQTIASLENEIPNGLIRAIAFYMAAMLNQYFFSGNKRVASLMMNAILLSEGIDAINILASKKKIYDEKMSRFFQTKNATEMMLFLMQCHPASTILAESSAQSHQAAVTKGSAADEFSARDSRGARNAPENRHNLRSLLASLG